MQCTGAVVSGCMLFLTPPISASSLRPRFVGWKSKHAADVVEEWAKRTFTLRAIAAAQCIVIGPICACVCLCVGVGESVTTITRNYMHWSSPNWVRTGKGNDHLQLNKFWPSRAPGKGVCGGAIFFGSALLQPARSVCVSLSAFSFR